MSGVTIRPLVRSGDAGLVFSLLILAGETRPTISWFRKKIDAACNRQSSSPTEGLCLRLIFPYPKMTVSLDPPGSSYLPNHEGNLFIEYLRRFFISVYRTDVIRSALAEFTKCGYSGCELCKCPFG